MPLKVLQWGVPIALGLALSNGAAAAQDSAPSARDVEGRTALRVVSEGPGALRRADPTVQFVVHSERAGGDFLVQVTPPVSKPWLPGQKAAVAYVLDGGYGIFGPSALLLGGSRAMAPAYIVTVAYAPGQRRSRERDMLFENATRPDGSVASGGGAEAFMAFLVEELRPYVEARYPVDPGRSILVGHSLSGTFTANVLARKPQAFAGYLIASPSVWADPAVVDRLARTPVLGSPRLVFVAYGEDEAPYMVRGGQQLASAVARNPAAFTSRAHVFAGADHISFYPELAAKGLGYLAPQTQPIQYPEMIAPPLDALRRYEGVYVLSDGRRVVVKGDRLTTALASSVELSPLPSPGSFFVEGYNALLTFDGRSDEAPYLLRIVLNGDEAVARREP